MSDVDTDISNALTDWLTTMLSEDAGPGKDARMDGGHWWTLEDATRVLMIAVPDVADHILSATNLIQRTPGQVTFADLWSWLPDHVIGTCMKAGAVEFLPIVDIVEDYG